MPWEIRVARAALHMWEEPQISGKRGSGTIFFCGCNLRCVYCQNRDVSRAVLGQTVSEEELIDVMLRLREAGAHNINLVTPTQYVEAIARVLKKIKPRLEIPVVYNCGGYESVETLRLLDGLVDVYLPDFKYFDSELSLAYSGAADYFSVACEALEEMLRQTGKAVYDDDGMLLRGTVVRHLVLPGCRKDSIEVLRHLAKRFGAEAFSLSLMSQYTPAFAMDTPYENLHRRVTSFEYHAVLDEAIRLGFTGNFQARSSATEAFTPDFTEKSFLPS